MFKPDRVFSTQNPKTWQVEWYFQTREGDVGPYDTREQAAAMLQKFIKTCVELSYTGRSEGESTKAIARLKLQGFLNFQAKNDLPWT